MNNITRDEKSHVELKTLFLSHNNETRKNDYDIFVESLIWEGYNIKLYDGVPRLLGWKLKVADEYTLLSHRFDRDVAGLLAEYIDPYFDKEFLSAMLLGFKYEAHNYFDPSVFILEKRCLIPQAYNLLKARNLRLNSSLGLYQDMLDACGNHRLSKECCKITLHLRKIFRMESKVKSLCRIIDEGYIYAWNIFVVLSELLDKILPSDKRIVAHPLMHSFKYDRQDKSFIIEIDIVELAVL